jgi:lysozyme
MSDLTPDYVAFVEKEEGFAAVAFWDYQQWTNGYGTRAHYPHEPITRPEAQQRLDVELDAAEAAVDRFAPNLPAGPRKALTDLTFNAGAGWMHAGLGVAVKAADWTAVKAHLLEYDRAGGKVNAGLLARRKTEEGWIS